MSETKVWTKADITSLIATNDKAVVRAVLVVYKNQTSAEKAIGATVEDNGRGFTGADGPFLSSLAEFATKTGFLTPKQIYRARQRVGKYWKQILKDMEGRGLQVSYK